MRVTPLSPSVGVQVHGIDLARGCDDSTLAKLEQLLDDELLVLLRDQKLSDRQGQNLFARFGPLIPGLGIVSNDEPTGRGPLQFHSERSFQREQPIRGLALYCEVASSGGGATGFVNCALAYETLPERLKEAVAGADAIHHFDPSVRLGSTYSAGSGVPEGGWTTTHPAVLPHPRTGRPILYVSPWFTTAVAGGGHEDLLGQLLRHLDDPVLAYRHNWQAGDLLVWDNLALIHAREPYDESKARILRKYEFGFEGQLALASPHGTA